MKFSRKKKIPNWFLLNLNDPLIVLALNQNNDFESKLFGFFYNFEVFLDSLGPFFNYN